MSSRFSVSTAFAIALGLVACGGTDGDDTGLGQGQGGTGQTAGGSGGSGGSAGSSSNTGGTAGGSSGSGGSGDSVGGSSGSNGSGDSAGGSSGSGGSDAGAGGTAGDASGGAGGTAGEGVGGCAPPCDAPLEASADPLSGFPPGAIGASLFYHISRETFSLRSGTTAANEGEELVIFFTWEDNQYGYGEWTQSPWSFVSVEPDVYVPDGQSRPENVELAATVERDAELRVEVTYTYADKAVTVHDAAKLP